MTADINERRLSAGLKKIHSASKAKYVYRERLSATGSQLYISLQIRSTLTDLM